MKQKQQWHWKKVETANDSKKNNEEIMRKNREWKLLSIIRWIMLFFPVASISLCCSCAVHVMNERATYQFCVSQNHQSTTSYGIMDIILWVFCLFIVLFFSLLFVSLHCSGFKGMPLPIVYPFSLPRYNFEFIHFSHTLLLPFLINVWFILASSQCVNFRYYIMLS